MFVVNYRGPLGFGLATPGRGEDRWCLNAAAALLDAGFPVALPVGGWPDSLSKPPGLRLECGDSRGVLLTYGQATEDLGWPPARFFVLNYYAFPGHLVQPLKNAVVTQCYSFVEREQPYLQQFGPKYRHLTHPAVPSVCPGDNFHKPLLVWTARLVPDSPFWKEVAPGLLQWVAARLREEPRLRFCFLTGASGGKDSLRRSGTLSLFSGVEDRVVFEDTLPWTGVLSLLEDAKLILNFGNYDHTFGGSVLEAASFGIPSVCFPRSPFVGLPEALTVSGWQDSGIIGLLDKLFHDQSFYGSCGSAYRTWVAQRYTYPVFVKQLLSILEDAGVPTDAY